MKTMEAIVPMRRIGLIAALGVSFVSIVACSQGADTKAAELQLRAEQETRVAAEQQLRAEQETRVAEERRRRDDARRAEEVQRRERLVAERAAERAAAEARAASERAAAEARAAEAPRLFQEIRTAEARRLAQEIRTAEEAAAASGADWSRLNPANSSRWFILADDDRSCVLSPQSPAEFMETIRDLGQSIGGARRDLRWRRLRTSAGHELVAIDSAVGEDPLLFWRTIEGCNTQLRTRQLPQSLR